MTLPANIRINMSAPFPALVKGSGLVTLTKQNGIWTVGFSIANVAVMPQATDPAVVSMLLWNSALNTFQQTTLAQLFAAPIAPTNIGFANSPYVPLISDSLLFVDTSGGPVVINLTASAARLSRPLSIKDVTGNAVANNITINRSGAETIEGLVSVKINANYGGYRLYPATGKYVIAP